MLEGLCERLIAAHIPLARVSIAGNLLDPVFSARGLRWRPGIGSLQESFARDGDDRSEEEWLRSPFFAIVESGASILRRRLDATYAEGEFPLLDGFRAEGMTDYVLFLTRTGNE